MPLLLEGSEWQATPKSLSHKICYLIPANVSVMNSWQCYVYSIGFVSATNTIFIVSTITSHYHETNSSTPSCYEKTLLTCWTHFGQLFVIIFLGILNPTSLKTKHNQAEPSFTFRCH